jgi:uncharacterized protein YraI
MTAYLIPFGVENRVRERATTNSTQLGTIPLGGVFTILDGPTCQDGYVWYRVNYEGLVGWTVEGGGGEYWIAELESEAPSDRVCEAYGTAAASVNLREQPSTNAAVADALSSGGSIVIVGQYSDGGGFVWWQLENDAWVRADAVGERGNCDAIPNVTP